MRVAAGIAKDWVSDDDVERVRLGGLLHDIGKIGIMEALLEKPKGLDDDEFPPSGCIRKRGLPSWSRSSSCTISCRQSCTTTNSTMAAVTRTDLRERIFRWTPALLPWPTPSMPWWQTALPQRIECRRRRWRSCSAVQAASLIRKSWTASAANWRG